MESKDLYYKLMFTLLQIQNSLLLKTAGLTMVSNPYNSNPSLNHNKDHCILSNKNGLKQFHR